MKHVFTPPLSGTQHSFWRKFTLMLTFGLSLGLTTSFGQISGVVFRDYDSNGIRTDTLPIEPGVGRITVRAYVGFVTAPLTTTTDAAGKYAFSAAQIAPGQPVRVEFSGLDPGYFVGFYGSGSGSLVQFATAPSTSVSVGINYPADYCPPGKLTTIVPCYVNGNAFRTTYDDGSPIPPDKQAGPGDVLIEINYDASGNASATNFPPAHIATNAEAGSLWGLAYQRRTGTMVSSAVIKRHTSLGPLGTGGLYQYTVETKVFKNFVDVKTLGIDTGQNPTGLMSGDKTQANTDADSFTLAAKAGMGGVDFSEDDKVLYLTNLKDRTIYSLPVGLSLTVPSAAAIRSYPIPNPGCPNGDFRPWALKMHRRKLYIGVVCTGETSGNRNELTGVVYRMDPTLATPVYEQVINFPLTFKRAPVDTTGGPNGCINSQLWLAWNNTWPVGCEKPNGQFVINPQPIISDIEFDDSDGSMLIGMADRFGFMAGTQNHDPSGNGLFDGISGGDLLRAAPDAAGTGFVLENNGTVGGRTGLPNSAGPGGGAFYWDKFWRFLGGIPHGEVLTGALVMVPGRGEVAASSYDPIDEIYKSGGFRFLNNKTGKQSRPGYAVYAYGAPGTFGKASGLGDSEPICGPAPVEIGNRLWYDTNRNGIQDPFEPGIDGIALTLNDLDHGGKEVGRTTTRNGGQYYFNNANVPTGLKPGVHYQVRYSFADIVARQPKGARVAARAYFLSPKNTASGTDGGERDSDAFMVGDSAAVNTIANDVGENNHSFDLSVYSCPTVNVGVDTITVCAASNIPVINGSILNAEAIDSVRYVLFDTPQPPANLYTGGTVLGTIKPTADGTANLLNPSILTTNPGTGAVYKYVYAILYPQALVATCRPMAETVIRINPEVSLNATGGSLTCSTTAVTMAGQLRYKDGSPVAGASYTWAGPGGFAAGVANPIVTQAGTYSVSASYTACADFPASGTAVVTLDKTPPALTVLASATAVNPNAPVKLTAQAAAGTGFGWTGPGGFSSALAAPMVTTAGTYEVNIIGTNGCPASLRITLEASPCLPNCIPVATQRIR